MKLTVLVDNTTIIDNYLLGEPGVCYLIESDGVNLLFDTGYSDVFIKNAGTLGIDLHELDAVVLSHGHNDHTWGLAHLARFYDRTHAPRSDRIKLIAHPDAFLPKRDGKLSIGADIPADGHARWMDRIECTQPYRISEELIFLGSIPRENGFEGLKPIGSTLDSQGHAIDDFVRDDSALVCTTPHGLVVVTGCSHSGICNIIDYAMKVTGEARIAAVIGGFHLQNSEPGVLQRTREYFEHLQAGTLYPCHCTDLRAKIELDRVSRIGEVGTGLVLDFDPARAGAC
ncbi:MBL fold metallo-hydrolase [Paludibacterium yongneupense]|uniref:MBL fold metallo-hydrolase n=1 Tax=Paludibacterium yongneupense TaxID=400061 RepID=UPI0003F8AF4F|nr:MBL fold metallo-hydrolase [Paludibacterium yongneupense]